MSHYVYKSSGAPGKVTCMCERVTQQLHNIGPVGRKHASGPDSRQPHWHTDFTPTAKHKRFMEEKTEEKGNMRV